MREKKIENHKFFFIVYLRNFVSKQEDKKIILNYLLLKYIIIY